jgi:hypothetical protein
MGPSIACSHDRVVPPQSEFLQLFSFVVLAALFIHRGSAESKDSDEQMQKTLDRIERRLKALEGDRAGKSS